MSKEYNIFFNKNIHFEELIHDIEKFSGLYFVEEKEESLHYFQTVIFGIEISVWKNHELDDEGIIRYSNYNFQIQFKRFAGLPEQEIQVSISKNLAFILASYISRNLQVECIVLEGLQKIIEKFPIPINPDG